MMMESRRKKVLLFSILSAALFAAPLFAAPAYSQESIFSSYYEGPFLQCKSTKRTSFGGCVVLKNTEDAKNRCRVVGNAGGNHWECKKSGEVSASNRK